jgi:sugar phosphate permease
MSSNNLSINTVNQTKTIALSKRRSSFVWACVMWGLAAVFYFYDYLLQVSPSAMKPELMQAFAKQAEQFGSLSAYCLYAYGLMQIPAGMLLDKFGPRRIITVACALCAIGSLIFGAATTLWVAKIGRLFIGAGAGFALLTCLKIASQWFPQNRYAFMTGLTVTVGFLGAAFGLSSVSEVVGVLGWRESMYWGGLVGLGLSALLWIVIRDKKKQQNEIGLPIGVGVDHFQEDNTTVVKGFVSVLKNKQTWIAALFAGLMFVPTLAFGGLWGIPFLVEAHGFDRVTAGKCISLIYVGWVFGGAFWGYISDYFRNRNIPMIIANICLFAVTVVLLYKPGLSLGVMQGLLFALGFFCSAFILAFAVIAENNPSSLASTASGFANALNTLWGALAQPLIGFILDLNAKAPVVPGGEQIFTLTEYQQAFIALPVCLVISFIFLIFIKETRCKRTPAIE